MDALTTILGKMHQDAAAPEMIEVFCRQHFRSLVRTRFQQQLAECIELRLLGQAAVGQDAGARQGKSTASSSSGAGCRSSWKTIDFTVHLPQQAGSPAAAHRQDSQPAPARHCRRLRQRRLVQFFFDTRDAGTNIYILDEGRPGGISPALRRQQDELVRG